MRKTIFGYSYQKLRRGGLLFQKGSTRNLSMSSGYRGKSRPVEMTPEKGAKRALYREQIADTDNEAYGKRSGDMAYQDAQRAKQQALVEKYGLLDDATLIEKYKAGEIDRETGQLLSDAYNRDLALKNNQNTYKRGFNSAIGLNADLEYLAGTRSSKYPEEEIGSISETQSNTSEEQGGFSKKGSSSSQKKPSYSGRKLNIFGEEIDLGIPNTKYFIEIKHGKRTDGTPNYNSLTAYVYYEKDDQPRKFQVDKQDILKYINSRPENVSKLVNRLIPISRKKHPYLFSNESYSSTYKE